MWGGGGEPHKCASLQKYVCDSVVIAFNVVNEAHVYTIIFTRFVAIIRGNLSAAPI